MHKLLLFLVVVNCRGIFSQDCQTAGQQCESDKNCCGGCCKENECINTYIACDEVEDPCMNHACPPGFECYIYQPECPGCAKTPDCIPVHEK